MAVLSTILTRNWPAEFAKKSGPVATCTQHVLAAPVLAHLLLDTVAQLPPDINRSQTIDWASVIPVSISLESFPPHKNNFGNSVPSFGHIETCPAYGNCAYLIAGLIFAGAKALLSSCSLVFSCFSEKAVFFPIWKISVAISFLGLET